MKKALFYLGVILTAGCHGQANKDNLQSPPLLGESLAQEAEDTYAAYTKAIRAGTGRPSDEIPAAYWTEGIKRLKPLKVYTHQVNVVVVQHVTENTEEGKYIYIPISSYLPLSGDDGFVFSPNPNSGNTYTLGNGVFDFKRMRNKE